MSNHALDMPEPPLDGPAANCELYWGQAQINSSPWPRIVPGPRVRVRCGEFAGAEGVVLERRPASCLLLAVDVHQQGIVLEIDGSALEPAD